MKWNYSNTGVTEEEIQQIVKKLNIDYITARILLNRGFSSDDIRIVMNDYHEAILDPRLLTNADLIAEKIFYYANNPNAVIEIFADYDVDGLTAGYIMHNGISTLAQAKVNVYFPNRVEGYGLNRNWAEKLINEKEDKEVLVITVDNGITQVEEINYLIENGIEVVVTDHHQAKEIVPNCLIADPHNLCEDDTYKHLAGCGVAFKVVQLVREMFGLYDMLQYTPYVALGTIADMMPMHKENMSFIKYGLDIINSDECPLGIKIFKEFMGIETLTSKDVGWELGPRLNSCGRLGDINKAASLFFETDEDKLTNIILEIEKYNDERKAATKKAKELMKDMNFDNKYVCIIDATEFPEGIVGILAGEGVKLFNKPTIVLSKTDVCFKGSVRSDSVNLQELFKYEIENHDTMINYGGHAEACGLSVKIDKLEEFKKNINNKVKDLTEFKLLTEEQVQEELIIDEIIDLNNINKNTYDLLNSLPFNNKDFTTPVFALTYVDIESYNLSKNNPSNICFTLKNKKKIWAWGMAEKYLQMNCPKQMHIAGNIDKDITYQGNYTLKIIDFIESV